MHVFVCTNLTQNSSTYTQAPRHTKEAKHIQLVESRIHTETHTAVGKGTQKTATAYTEARTTTLPKMT